MSSAKGAWWHSRPEVSDRDYREISEFLFREAQLLDAGRFTEWLVGLTEDVRYQLVAPTISMSTPGSDLSDNYVVLMDETLGSLKTRALQLGTPAFSIAENPRSLTRRFVTNILIDPGAEEHLIQATSNLLVHRSRMTQSAPHLFSISRTDCLRRDAEGFHLARRFARLDEAIVGARNVSTLF